MKKNYAYTFENGQPQWRQLYLTFCTLCMFMGLSLSNTAHAVTSTSETANDYLYLWLGTPDTGNILDCYTKEVKIVSQVSKDGVPLTDGVTYSWTGPNGFTSTLKDLTVTVPGTYRLTARYKTGEYGNNFITVYGNGFVTNFAGSDKIMYSTTETVKLGGYAHGINGTVHENYTVSWEASNGGNIVSGANTLTPVVDAPGTYTITLTHTSGCTMQDSMVVTRSEDVLFARIGNGSIVRIDCKGTPVQLESHVYLNYNEVTEGITYSWTGPNGFASEAPIVSVKEPGTYTLEVKHLATGLTATAKENVTQLPFTKGSAGPDKKLTCENPTVTLEGSASLGYPIWFASDGGNIVSGYNTLNPVVDAPGTYTLRLTFERGCPTEYTVKVTRDEGPSVSATGGRLDCTTGASQLTGSSDREGVTYSWTGPNGYTSTEQNPTVKVAGEYTLTVTDPEAGCTASTKVVVTPASTELEVKNHLIDFNGQKRGLITSINTEAGPVALIGRKRNQDGSYAPENHAAIFDSQDPTADDANLYTVNWGEVLIINQYQNNLPDANQWGGELILDFSAIGPVTMESIDVVGMDHYEHMSWVYLYDADGKELHKEYIKPLGLNSKQTVNLGNTRGVMKMKVVFDGRDGSGHFAGSGAINDIKFHQENTVSAPCQAQAENITFAKAYPTEFSDQTKIEFIVRETESYSISLYDTQGMLIQQLKEGTARAGEMTSVEVKGRHLKEGMYMARLVTASGAKTFKLILKR